MSKLWRALITISVNVLGDFTFREFTTALQHLKPGKAPGLVSVGRGDVGPMKQKVSLGRWRDGFLCILLHTCLLYSLQWYVL